MEEPGVYGFAKSQTRRSNFTFTSLPQPNRGRTQAEQGRSVRCHKTCIHVMQMRMAGLRMKPAPHGLVMDGFLHSFCPSQSLWEALATPLGTTVFLSTWYNTDAEARRHPNRAQISVSLSQSPNLVPFSDLSNGTEKKKSTYVILFKC